MFISVNIIIRVIIAQCITLLTFAIALCIELEPTEALKGHRNKKYLAQVIIMTYLNSKLCLNISHMLSHNYDLNKS